MIERDGRLQETADGLVFRREVTARVRRSELAAGAVVVVVAIAGAWGAGFGGIGMGIAGIVGLVAGHIPALRPGGGEIRLWVDGRRIEWHWLEHGAVVDRVQVPLRDVVDAVVMPNEGCGWGIEVHHRDGDRVRVWTPRLPLPSAGEARQLVDWIRVSRPGRAS